MKTCLVIARGSPQIAETAPRLAPAAFVILKAVVSSNVER
jgi:hypothetical protein